MKNVVYTKKGDKGETSLGDKTRVAKTHPLLEAIGTLDELNAFISILPSFNPYLDIIQNQILNIGAYLSNPTKQKHLLKNLPKVIISMETEIDIITQELPELHDFVLPKGYYHIARTICRRAERRLVKLLNGKDHEKTVEDNFILMFINRLSDYLFMLARQNNRMEIPWKKG